MAPKKSESASVLKEKVKAIYDDILDKRQEMQIQLGQNLLSQGQPLDPGQEVQLADPEMLETRRQFRVRYPLPKDAIKKAKKGKKTQRYSYKIIPLCVLEDPGPPLPPHSVHRAISKSFFVEDERELSFVPYLGDDRDTRDLLHGFDLDKRLEQVEQGPDFLRQEAADIVDQVLTACCDLQWNGKGVWSSVASAKVAVGAIADLCEVTERQVLDQYQELLDKYKKATAKNEATPPLYCLPVTEDNDESYLEAADSYRAMWCRRCFVFCCNLHGLSNKPSLQFQLERVKELESDAKKEASAGDEDEKDFKISDDAFAEVKELSQFQKLMCKRIFLIFDGHLDKMANALRAPKHLLQEYIRDKGFELPQRNELPKLSSKNKKKDYYSVNYYREKWYRAIEKAVIHPFFVPCSHEDPCSDYTCSCVRDRFFCTLACSWGSKSQNFFRGCKCKGGCNKNSCTCFATKRECDPDLCGCDTCQDPAGEVACRQTCRNDNIRMRRYSSLAVAPSTVSGWGLFAQRDIPRGTFIHEYLGEMITQEEADRRGQIDDARKRSYHFMLSSDYVLDARVKGGKSRFINDSDTPNCEPKTLFVNGEQRIGLFAIEDIKAQEELFFDYGYHKAMDNELVKKSAKLPDWKRTKKGQKRPAGQTREAPTDKKSKT